MKKITCYKARGKYKEICNIFRDLLNIENVEFQEIEDKDKKRIVVYVYDHALMVIPITVLSIIVAIMRYLEYYFNGIATLEYLNAEACKLKIIVTKKKRVKK